jgi:hypothetical protein
MKLENIELFKEEIRRKDLQLIQNIYKKDILIVKDRFKKWKNFNGWDNFIRKMESNIDNNKEDTNVEFAPIRIMCKFIENGGDPLVYLKVISISYPEHPFSQMLIECKTVQQFLDKLRPLEARLHKLFLEDGKSKKWLSELFDEYMSHLFDSQELQEIVNF